MLAIRPEQFAKLEEASISAFHRRLMAFLRRETPAATRSLDDAALLEHIAEVERRAGEFNIKSQSGIAQFACLSLSACPNFDELPEVREFLQSPDRDPEEKLDALISYLDVSENAPHATASDVLPISKNLGRLGS